MKIALVCKVYPSQRSGGMPFVCQDRARALVKLGHEVRVFSTGLACSTKGIRLQHLDDHGVEVYHLPCKPTDYSREFADHLATIVQEFAPDILHLDSFDNQRPWWRQFKGKTKLALTLHGFCWGAYFTQLNLVWRQEMSLGDLKWDFGSVLREREFMTDFDAVIGISLHEQQLLKQMMGLHNTKLVYNPLPDYFFEDTVPLPTTGKRKFLCAAVSGHGTRGFHYAKTAADKAGVELVVAKDIERKAMPAFIDSCHGLVLPTAYAQGLDLCVGEAIVRKRSVIVTSTGSYLRESECCGLYSGLIRLVPLVDPVEAIAKAMTDPTSWDFTGEAAILEHRADYHTRKWLEAVG